MNNPNDKARKTLAALTALAESVRLSAESNKVWAEKSREHLRCRDKDRSAVLQKEIEALNNYYNPLVAASIVKVRSLVDAVKDAA